MAARSGYERGRAIYEAYERRSEACSLVGISLYLLGLPLLLRWMDQTFSEDVKTLLCLGIVAAVMFIGWLIELYERRRIRLWYSLAQDLSR
jgi:hypothetical protein